MIRRFPRKDRNAFRPSLGDSSLEDRLVLNAAATVAVLALTVPITPPPAPAPVSPAMAVAQVRRAIRQQARSLATDVRTAINDRVAALYANGKPTSQQVADFNAEVMGISDAAALRLSGQAALLPASSGRLIPGIQNALLGSGSNSLISRIQSLAASGRTAASASTLQAAGHATGERDPPARQCPVRQLLHHDEPESPLGRSGRRPHPAPAVHGQPTP